MKKFIKFLIWGAFFIATLFMLSLNPFSIPGWYGLAYAIPFFIYSYMAMESPIRKSGVFDDPKYLKALQSVISLLAMLLAAGVKIPGLSNIIDLLGMLVSNWDDIKGIVTLIIGLYAAIRAIFADKNTPLIGPVAKMLSGVDIVEPREKHL